MSSRVIGPEMFATAAKTYGFSTTTQVTAVIDYIHICIMRSRQSVLRWCGSHKYEGQNLAADQLARVFTACKTQSAAGPRACAVRQQRSGGYCLLLTSSAQAYGRSHGAHVHTETDTPPCCRIGHMSAQPSLISTSAHA